MSLSNRDAPFELTSLPLLDLMSGPVSIDIGYLGGAEHRQAFAEIFDKVLNDNARLLAGSQLARVDATRAVHDGPNLPIAAHDLIAGSARVALALYDSRNDSIRLHFTSPGRSLGIGVRFDNPEFWLE